VGYIGHSDHVKSERALQPFSHQGGDRSKRSSGDREGRIIPPADIRNDKKRVLELYIVNDVSQVFIVNIYFKLIIN